MFRLASVIGILSSVVIAVSASADACVIYPASGPFYTADYTIENKASAKQLKFVSYNIAANPSTEMILGDLQKNSTLNDADFIVLQEVVSPISKDDSTAKALAAKLKMNFVFSPNIVLWNQDYGNAILSKWPLVSMKKVYLPRSTKENCNQRSFIVGVYRTPHGDIQVASAHLSVIFSDTIWGRDNQRTAQFEVGLKRLNETNLPTFVAGDLNTAHPGGTSRLLKMTKNLGYANAQPKPGRTNKYHRFQLDRAFSRGGFTVVNSGIEYQAISSDHFPVWSLLKLD